MLPYWCFHLRVFLAQTHYESNGKIGVASSTVMEKTVTKYRLVATTTIWKLSFKAKISGWGLCNVFESFHANKMGKAVTQFLDKRRHYRIFVDSAVLTTGFRIGSHDKCWFQTAALLRKVDIFFTHYVNRSHEWIESKKLEYFPFRNEFECNYLFNFEMKLNEMRVAKKCCVIFWCLVHGFQW